MITRAPPYQARGQIPVKSLMRARAFPRRLASVTDEELIELMAVTVQLGCARMTAAQLVAFSDCVARAEALPARPWWDRKAVAHAEAIGLLGEMTGEPALIRLAGLAAGWTYDRALAAGRAADQIILGSHRRLVDHLQAGDADAAAREISKQLRVLGFMARLSPAWPGARSPACPSPARPGAAPGRRRTRPAAAIPATAGPAARPGRRPRPPAGR